MSIIALALSSPVHGDGACCLEGGSECSQFPDETLCTLFGGTWMGEGTACSDIDCTLGACCLFTFQLECWEQVAEDDCYTQGGDFLGPLSTCEVEGYFCQSDIGACCIDGNDCWDSVSEEECGWFGGEFMGDETTCANDAPWCVTYWGSCCFGDSCQEGWEHDECEYAGGVFWIDPCELLQDVEMCVPSGACCLADGTCLTNVASDYCSQLDGYYYGDGTTDCYECFALGACCMDDGSPCFESNWFDCMIAGGVEHHEGMACDSQICGGCNGDANQDFMVDVEDLLLVMAYWGSENQDCDFDSSGTVDVSDLLVVVSAWGSCE